MQQQTSGNNNMTKQRKRMAPDIRKADILDAAIAVAINNGYRHVTRDQVAEQAGVSTGLVTTYFSTMPRLRRQIVRYAMNNDIQQIIGQAVVNQDPQTIRLSPEQKQRAIQSLVV